MRVLDIITEAQVPPIKDQILADVRKHGGALDEYFVRFTDIDKLGYSAKQLFGRSPDIDHPKFDPDYIGARTGRPALWFYPLKTYLADKDIYAGEKPYVWLIKIKPDAWLQPTNRNTKQIEPAPEGKQRVGMLRLASVYPAAIFFKPAFDVVGKYYDYAGQHRRHGEVKGRPNASWFDRVRGQT